MSLTKRGHLRIRESSERLTRSASLEDVRRRYTVPVSCRPPPASISKNLGRLIFCQVCGCNMEIPLNYSKLVMLCRKCGESTPARPPPSDKRFFRCDCGRLVLVSVYVGSVNCPRLGCRRELILPAASVVEIARPQSVSTQVAWEMRQDSEMDLKVAATRPMELRCGSCYQRFFTPSTSAFNSDARCPHCKKRTSVGPDFARYRFLTLFSYAVVSLIVSLSISILTYVFRHKTGGIYTVHVDLFYEFVLITFIKISIPYKMDGRLTPQERAEISTRYEAWRSIVQLQKRWRTIKGNMLKLTQRRSRIVM